jgi:hypothetical protein
MKSKISKILGIGLTAGLVLGLIGAVFAAPVSADLMKWSKESTPDRGDMVILPQSDILDYDIGGDGDTIYAVLELDEDCPCTDSTGYIGSSCDDFDIGFALVKSTDGGVTWSDITAKVTGAANLPAEGFNYLVCVSVAPDDEDWVAVAGYQCDTGDPMVVASKDGGSNFTYTGDMMDSTNGTVLESIFDLDVSIEVDGIHNIAVAGENDYGAVNEGANGTVYRLQAGTWLSASWVDTTYYLGWDGDPDGIDVTGVPRPDTTDGVIAIEFSPNFDIDDTIVAFGVDGGITEDLGQPLVQSGIWEGSGGSWNASAGFPNPIAVTSDGDTLLTGVYWRAIGLSLPADYDGSDSGARAIFLYANSWNATTGLVGGCVFRLDNNALSPVCGPPGDPLLASIDVHGDADTGKVMIGEYIRFDNVGGWDGVTPAPPAIPTGWGPVEPNCCEGVRVWHTEELDFCCPQWDGACKDPSGFFTALVMYTPDGAKEYVSTSGTVDEDMGNVSHADGTGVGYSNAYTYSISGNSYYGFFDSTFSWWGVDFNEGTPGDESAFSVSRDDAVSFNQISLIDTDIDYLSDVAVCPDCSTIYLSTINTIGGDGDNEPCDEMAEYDCHCDSVWRSYDDGDTWERVFHGDWVNSPDNQLLLRLPCDAIEDCCDQDAVAPSGTVYLAIQESYDIFYSRDCGQCWNDPPATKDYIQDVAVESENIVYVLHEDGGVSKSTQYGRRWSDPVDTDLGQGHTIAACCDEGFVVVGPDIYSGGKNKVAWSDDGGETWNLTDALPSTATGWVVVACDPVCENIIYAAADKGGIYRTDITDGAWDTISVLSTMGYTGIVVANEGTLYASFDNIYENPSAGLCDSDRFAESGGGSYTVELSGAARNLTPCETACCGKEDWDYLVCGLSDQGTGGEDFDKQPSALKICGCLTVDTNSRLWAIDNTDYELCDGSDGALWTYEDCAAKLGPTLTSPADGTVLDCEPCAGCDAANFTLKWERMCEACSYDIEIMDATGNVIASWSDIVLTGDPPSLFVDGSIDSGVDHLVDYYYIECGETYTWHVREANTSCECVHSPWSDTWTFTVAVGAADAIDLLAPTKGAMDVPIQNVGFSWTSVRNATSYSFVLSPNANLTGALVSQDMSTTAFNYVGPLDYSKAYYWQIIAWEDGTRLTTSSIGVFNTMAEPAAPTPPVVVEQQPAPVINIPPAEKITPTWIYAIIGIGCALAVVVIVLIVRTRRP